MTVDITLIKTKSQQVMSPASASWATNLFHDDDKLMSAVNFMRWKTKFTNTLNSFEPSVVDYIRTGTIPFSLEQCGGNEQVIEIQTAYDQLLLFWVHISVSQPVKNRINQDQTGYQIYHLLIKNYGHMSFRQLYKEYCSTNSSNGQGPMEWGAKCVNLLQWNQDPA
ncbi:hypothetical protein KL942_004562, partial [Ogataea angusta]